MGKTSLVDTQAEKTSQNSNPIKMQNTSDPAKKEKKFLGIIPKVIMLSLSYCMLHAFVKSMIDLRELTAKYKIVMRDISDIWLVIIAALLCALIPLCFNFFFKEHIVANIKAQNIPNVDFIVNKVLKQGKDIFYYTFSSVSV